jgi:putative NADH-flavin reductase
MNVALFGASGTIGIRILHELLERGHSVTGVARDAARVDVRHERLRTVSGSSTQVDDVARIARGHDAIVVAIGPRHGVESNWSLFAETARAVTAAARRAGVKRILVVGGAGSLNAKPGLQVVDAPEFPAMWKGNALGQRDALEIYRKASDLDWTYISPAALIQPGQRTGHFRVGGDDLLVDAQGQSRISTEDYAAALVDELELGKAIRRRITVAY